jgi:hypothetical protein
MNFECPTSKFLPGLAPVRLLNAGNMVAMMGKMHQNVKTPSKWPFWGMSIKIIGIYGGNTLSVKKAAFVRD